MGSDNITNVPIIKQKNHPRELKQWAVEHYWLDTQRAHTNESLNGDMVLWLSVLYNRRFSLFNVSIVSKLSRIPFFLSDQTREWFHTDEERLCTEKRNTEEQRGWGQIVISLCVSGFREEVQPLCNILYMSLCVKEIERDREHQRFAPLVRGRILRWHQWGRA